MRCLKALIARHPDSDMRALVGHGRPLRSCERDRHRPVATRKGAGETFRRGESGLRPLAWGFAITMAYKRY